MDTATGVWTKADPLPNPRSAPGTRALEPNNLGPEILMRDGHSNRVVKEGTCLTLILTTQFWGIIKHFGVRVREYTARNTIPVFPNLETSKIRILLLKFLLGLGALFSPGRAYWGGHGCTNCTISNCRRIKYPLGYRH